jgi:hypothetical protein
MLNAQATPPPLLAHSYLQLDYINTAISLFHFLHHFIMVSDKILWLPCPASFLSHPPINPIFPISTGPLLLPPLPHGFFPAQTGPKPLSSHQATVSSPARHPPLSHPPAFLVLEKV